MNCSKCGYSNKGEATFCEKCGNRLTKEKVNRFNPLFIIIVAICIAVLAGSSIWAANAFSPYNRQVRIGYKLMNDANYNEAVLAFDKAIEIETKKTKAYIGKANAFAGIVDEKTAENISKTIITAYKETQAKEIIDAANDIAETLTEDGYDGLAYQIIKEISKEVNDQSFVEYITSADKMIFNEYRNVILKYQDALYGIYDIDKNEIPELFIRGGVVNEEKIIYSFKNKQVYEMGKIPEQYFGCATMPADNGLILLETVGQEDDFHYEAKLLFVENFNSLKYESISENGEFIIRDEKTGVRLSSICDGGMLGDANLILEGSEWLQFTHTDDMFLLHSYFNKYDNPGQAYKEVALLYLDQYSHYALFDIDRNGIKELILINYREINTNYTHHTALDGNVYSLYDGKLKECGYLDSSEALYECNDIGILCKNIEDESSRSYNLFEMKNGIIPEYGVSYLMGIPYKVEDGYTRFENFSFKYSTISEAEFLNREKGFKKIEVFSINDVKPIEELTNSK